MDIEKLILTMKESELKRCLKEISTYSCFVALNQARDIQVVKDMQRKLNAVFVPDYGKMLSAFNGGMLFSTRVYGIDTEDSSMDLMKMNKYLQECGAMTEDVMAIAQEDYGDYICMRKDGSCPNVYLYGVDEDSLGNDGALKCIDVWEDIYAWLMDELVAGEEQIAEDELEPYVQ